jgi:hypothetical protein
MSCPGAGRAQCHAFAGTKQLHLASISPRRFHAATIGAARRRARKRPAMTNGATWIDAGDHTFRESCLK